MQPTDSSDDLLPFGFKQHWIATRCSTPTETASALGLREIQEVTWNEGVRQVYARGIHSGNLVFVTPPIGDWTLAVGGHRVIPQAPNPDWIPYLEKLSKVLGHVQYFGTHRVVGYVAWAMAEDGRLVRAYAYLGENEETIANIGCPTPEETALGIDFLDERSASADEIEAHSRRASQLEDEIDMLASRSPERDRLTSDWLNMENPIQKYYMTIPDEESVMLVAGRWSVDPMQPERYKPIRLGGLLGKLG